MFRDGIELLHSHISYPRIPEDDEQEDHAPGELVADAFQQFLVTGFHQALSL